MLKTIKKTKLIKLDELIQYCRDNNIKNKSFYTVDKKDIGFEHGKLIRVPKEVKFDGNGRIVLWGYLDLEELFEVEIEEEITKDTEFDMLIELFFLYEEYCTVTHFNKSIRHIEKDSTLFIFALINDKLELIYEVEDNNGEE